MSSKDRITNLYLITLLPFALGAAGWAVYNFPTESVSWGLAVLSVITVFFSSYLRIQLPRTKIHLTISDALIFLSLLLYGGEVAVLLVVFETAFTSFAFRQQGVAIRWKTAAINVLIGSVSVFGTATIVNFVIGPVKPVIENGTVTDMIWLLSVMAISQFVFNSFFVSAVMAVRSDSTIWQVWNEYCLNALVLYCTGAIMAGLVTKSLGQINVVLFVGVIGFFALVYLTYRRYLNDVTATAAKAEQAERERAEQAEKHVAELQHYVAELEKSGEALRRSRERFRHAAYHDALTGLANRNQLIDSIRGEIDKKKRSSKHQFAVLFLDLDRFKTINDSLGHSTGDRLIRSVADRLTKTLGKEQLLGRFSGDEFAILSTVRDADDATKLADRVAETIAEPFDLNGRKIFMSVSIGIALGSPNYSEAEEMLRDADIAMYYAKEGTGHFEIFDQNMHAQAVSLLQLETDLRLAIGRKELELYYQPVIELGGPSLVGFEALVRWNHPKHGVVPPNNFIPVAEATGLIVPLTLEILRMACEQMAEWHNRYRDEVPMWVSVNISGKHFAQPDLVDQLRAILAETKLPPQCLKLEITESAVMENAERAIEMLRQIRETGVRLCIDDFGTGHSSLSYLHRFPVDTLKVDRSFVCTMEDGSENGEIVRTVIALAKILKLTVVAEGIESIHQFHQLRVLGCEYGQGYLFSRPLPVADIEKMLSDRFNWENILPMPDYASIAQNKEFSRLIQ